MKKLLLIFLALAISFSAISQTDHKKGAKSDVINESTSGVGVTIESLLIKDGVTRYDDSLSVHNDSIMMHTDDISSLVDVTVAALARIQTLEDSVYTIQPPVATLLAYYKFDENLLDETVNNYDGTAVGTPTYTDRDIANFVVSLQGGDVSNIIGPVPITSAFTFITDVIVGTTNEPYRVIAENISGGSGFKWILNPTDSTIIFRTFTSATDSSSLTTPVGSFNITPLWNYTPFRCAVVGNTSSGVGAIYINGANTNATGSIETGLATSSAIRLGSADAPLYAMLDNFKIYAGSLTSTEISNDWVTSDYYSQQETTSPTVLALETISDSGFTVAFTENLDDTAIDSIADAFTYTADDVVISIDSAIILESVITFYTDPSNLYEVDEVLELDYDDTYYSGVKDLYGNVLASFTDSVVQNNVVSYLPAIAYYKFENNGSDDKGSYDGSLVSNAEYDATLVKCGLYALKIDAATEAFNAGAINFGTTFTISFWVNPTNITGNQYFCANSAGSGSDGFFIYTADNGVINFRISDGVNNSFADSDPNAIDFNGWQQVTIAVDKDSDTVAFWVDGIYLTNDNSLVNYDFATSGNDFYIGATNTPTAGATASYDEFVVFDELLDADEVLELYTDQCAYSFGPGDIAPPLPPVDPTEFLAAVDTFMTEDFEGFDEGQYTQEMLYETWGHDGYSDFWQDQNGNYTAVTGISYPVGVDRVYIKDIPAITGDSSYAANKAYSVPAYENVEFPTNAGQSIYPEVADKSERELYFSVNFMWTPGASFYLQGKFPVGFVTEGVATQGRPSGTYNYLDEGTNWGTMFDKMYTEQTIKYYYDYPAGGDHYNSSPRIYDPDNWGTTLDIDVTDSIWHNLTIRMGMDATGTDGVMEYFYDGKLASTVSRSQIVVYSEYNIGWVRMPFFFGGGSPIHDLVTLLLDDLVVFDYTDTYKTTNGLPTGKQPSSPGRELLLFNWPKQ